MKIQEWCCRSSVLKWRENLKRWGLKFQRPLYSGIIMVTHSQNAGGVFENGLQKMPVVCNGYAHVQIIL